MTADKEGAVSETPFNGYEQNRELLTFLRQENEANRNALRQDAEANRSMLLNSIKFVSYPVTALIALAAFLGWRSVSDLKQSISSTADGEAKKEMTLIRNNLEKQVNERLAKEFEQSNIKADVRQAAQEFIQRDAGPLVKHEVDSQWKLRIGNEIQKDINLSVDQLQQRLDAIDPPRAKIRDAKYDFSPLVVGQPFSMKATFRNVGTLEAQSVAGHAIVAVYSSKDQPSEREAEFWELVDDMRQRVRTGAGVQGGNTVPNSTLILTGIGPVLTDEEFQKLGNGTDSVYFLYFIRYADQRGGNWVSYYCGSSTGDFKSVQGCNLPSDWIQKTGI